MQITKEDIKTIDTLLEYWEHALLQCPMVDYGEMVGAPEWAHGIKYVYDDPEGYMIEYTIEILKKIKENGGKE